LRDLLPERHGYYALEIIEIERFVDIGECAEL